MKYLEYDDTYWACDIEADNLLDKATRIWCVCVENIKTGDNIAFTDSASFKAWLPKDVCLVGHNFIAYDLVMLNRFWDAGLGVRSIVDTYVLSQLYNPTFAGGHSLSAWGDRLKFPKGEHNDWTAFSPEMLGYCQRDTELTAKLHRKLSARMASVGFSELGCELEHLSWHIIQNKQRRYGFPFDRQKAEELYATLRAREQELQNEIYKLFPPQYSVVASFSRRSKQDGTPTANYLRHLQQYPELRDRADGGYDAYDFVSFNIGSPKQRVEKLIEAGWQPSSFTPTGAPKVDEESLKDFADSSGIPEVTAIANWLVCNSRGNMVRTWLDSCDADDRIRGKVFIASTLRYRHSSPNTANIPAVKTGQDKEILYGEAGTWAYECRDLWTCGDPDRYSLVGVDAKGIQIRILLNYAYSQSAYELYTQGDPHIHNARVLGLVNKPAAKKFFYCVPLDTTCLTRNGWKGYDEVSVGDEILSYNKNTGKQEWTPVLEKVYFDNAPVTEMGGKTWSVRSTPNHRWFVQQRKNHVKNSELPIEVKTTEELTTMQNIIVNAPLEDCGVDNENPMALSKYSDDWVKAVCHMSQSERRAFLAGFCIADGFQDSAQTWRWTQLRGPLFEAALTASYLVNDGKLYASTRTQPNGNEIGAVVLSKKPHLTTAHMYKKDLEEQPVWCVRTKNDSWVIRQGDFISITGNTLIMGGAGKRLAEDQLQFGTKLTAKQGAEMKERMIDTIPGFKDLIRKLENELERTGRIKLCDGTPILVPSPHMVIPYLLQGDESRIMKLANIWIDREIRRAKIEAFKVGDIHDEGQYVVRCEHVPRFIELALSIFPQVGRYYNYRVPIEGDAKVGKTWAGTH